MNPEHTSHADSGGEALASAAMSKRAEIGSTNRGSGMHRYPMSSSNPSIAWSISSVETAATRRPKRSAESVRIWLIFTQEGWGNSALSIFKVRGNPAF